MNELSDDTADIIIALTNQIAALKKENAGLLEERRASSVLGEVPSIRSVASSAFVAGVDFANHRRYEKAGWIELSIARWFGIRQNLIVPNVSWGLWIHECDVLVLTKAGYALEVEIKVSKSDLIKDGEKRHGHRSEKIKRLYFAIPEKLEKHMDLIPERAGVIVVRPSKTIHGRCDMIRPGEVNKAARPLGDKDREQLARLGALRIWDLKEGLLRSAWENEDLRALLPKDGNGA